MPQSPAQKDGGNPPQETLSTIPKDTLSEVVDTHNKALLLKNTVEAQDSPRALRSRKSVAVYNIDTETGFNEKNTKSSEATKKLPIKDTDDLMQVDQTPTRRGRKSVAFKKSEETTEPDKKSTDGASSDLETSTTPARRGRKSRAFEQPVQSETPKRGRKSVVPALIEKETVHKSPLRVMFAEGEEQAWKNFLNFHINFRNSFRWENLFKHNWNTQWSEA